MSENHCQFNAQCQCNHHPHHILIDQRLTSIIYSIMVVFIFLYPDWSKTKGTIIFSVMFWSSIPSCPHSTSSWSSSPANHQLDWSKTNRYHHLIDHATNHYHLRGFEDKALILSASTPPRSFSKTENKKTIRKWCVKLKKKKPSILGKWIKFKHVLPICLKTGNISS